MALSMLAMLSQVMGNLGNLPRGGPEALREIAPRPHCRTRAESVTVPCLPPPVSVLMLRGSAMPAPVVNRVMPGLCRSAVTRGGGMHHATRVHLVGCYTV